MKIAYKITDHIKKIEEIIKENSNKKKEISINNSSTNNSNKLEKDPIIDEKLIEFCEEIENLIHDDIIGLYDLNIKFENYCKERRKNKPFNENELELIEQIKIDGELITLRKKFKKIRYDEKTINKDKMKILKKNFEKYYNKRNKNNPFNKNELELVKQIKEGGLAKIENMLNKESKIDKTLNELHEKFKNSHYSINNIDALKKLKQEIEEYDKKRLDSNNKYNNEEIKIINEINDYIKKNSNKKKEISINNSSTNNSNKLEKKPIIDEKLIEFCKEIENLNNNNNNDIDKLKKLKQEFKEYNKKRLNPNNYYSYEEFRIADKITDYIEKIDKTTEKNSNNKKEVSINNSSTNNSNKLEKKPIIDEKLKKFRDEFKNSHYNINNIEALEKLKQKFGEYDNKRLDTDNYYNEEEFKIAEEITGYIEKIKNIIKDKESSKNAEIFMNPFRLIEYKNIENDFERFEEEDEKSKIDDTSDYYKTFFETRRNDGLFNEDEMNYNDNDFNLTETDKKSKNLQEYLNFIKEKDDSHDLNNKKTLVKNRNKIIFCRIPKKGPTIYDKLKNYEKKFNNFNYNKSDFIKLKEEFEKYMNNIINERPLNDDEEELTERIYNKIGEIEKKFVEITKKEQKIDTILENYKEKFKNFNYNKSNISKLTQLKEEFEEYINVRNNRNPLNDDERKLCNEIYDKIYEIEDELTKITKKEQKIDTILENYKEKFNNFNYNKSNMSDLTQLKEEFEKYINVRNDRNPLNNGEKKLMDEIYDKIYEIKNMLYEIADEKEQNKKEQIKNNSKSFYEKFEDANYKNNYYINKINNTKNPLLPPFEIKQYKDKQKREQRRIETLENLKNELERYNENKKELKEKLNEELKPEIEKKLEILENELKLKEKQYSKAYYYDERFHIPSKIENIEKLLIEKKKLLTGKIFNEINQIINFISQIEKELYEMKKVCLDNILEKKLIEKIESNLETTHTIKSIITLNVYNITLFFEKLIKEYKKNNSNDKKNISDLKTYLEKFENIMPYLKELKEKNK